MLTLLENVERSEGTIAFLQLISDVRKSFIIESSTVEERLYYAIKSVIFVRHWKNWIKGRGYGFDCFITQNSWDCLEINLIHLVKLSISGKAANFTEMCSQKCERFFRLLRSLTGMESTIVNVTMKAFKFRAYKIELEEKLMQELGEKITFPKQIARSLIQRKLKEEITWEDIEKITLSAETAAIEKLISLGIECTPIQAENFWKAPKVLEANDTTDENYQETEIVENDFFGICDLSCNLDVMNNSGTGEDVSEKEEKIKFLRMIQNNGPKVSPDIAHRFKAKKQKIGENESHRTCGELLWKSHLISKGQKIALEYGNEFVVGNVFDFRFLRQKYKSRMIFTDGSVDLTQQYPKDVGILLEPSYEISKLGVVLQEQFHDYINIKQYKCHFDVEVDVTRVNLYASIKNI